jgi:hypothetical protein
MRPNLRGIEPSPSLPGMSFQRPVCMRISEAEKIGDVRRLSHRRGGVKR